MGEILTYCKYHTCHKISFPKVSLWFYEITAVKGLRNLLEGFGVVFSAGMDYLPCYYDPTPV